MYCLCDCHQCESFLPVCMQCLMFTSRWRTRVIPLKWEVKLNVLRLPRCLHSFLFKNNNNKKKDSAPAYGQLLHLLQFCITFFKNATAESDVTALLMNKFVLQPTVACLFYGGDIYLNRREEPSKQSWNGSTCGKRLLVWFRGDGHTFLHFRKCFGVTFQINSY